MVAEDPIQKTWEDDSSDLDESVETLSLCDLPMYGDIGGDWDDSFKDDQSSSSDQEFFEFFSEDFTASTSPAAENIVFCGKLITYKKLPVCEDTQKLEDRTEKKQQQPKKGGLLQRGLKSFKRGKESRSKSMDGSHGKGLKLQQAPSSKSLPDAAAENYGLSPRKSEDKYDFTFPRMPIMTYPPKSQWQMFFGMVRIPTEMELRDIKNRQSRRTPSMLVTSPEEGKKGGGHKRKGKSLWGLLKALGCSSSHANTVAKASPSCNIPQPESVRWVD